jgi:hypothetical protein
MQIIKHIHIRFLIAIVVMMFFSFGTKAQNGTVRGTVIDEKTKEPIPFASVAIEKDGKIITGASADINGNYTIDSIPAGSYILKSTSCGYDVFTFKNQIIKNDSILIKDFCLKSNGNSLAQLIDIIWKVPLIEIDPCPSGQTITSMEIIKMAW